MSRVGGYLLTVLAAVLAVLLYGEWQTSPSGSPSELQGGRPPVWAPVTARAANPHDHDMRWAELILARPLFSPTRRPPEMTDHDKPGLVAVPRLAGVVVGAGQAGAIFAEAGSKPIVVKVGDRVGPYTVKSVAVGQVTVEGPSGTEVLHPAFAPSGGESGRQTTALPQPLPPALPGLLGGGQIPSPDAIRRLIEKQENRQ